MLFEDIIAEDIEDGNSVVGGSDNMSAILIEFQNPSNEDTITTPASQK